MASTDNALSMLQYRKLSPEDKEKVLKHVDETLERTARFVKLVEHLCDAACIEDTAMLGKFRERFNAVARYWRLARMTGVMDPLVAAHLYYTQNNIPLTLNDLELGSMTFGHFYSVISDVHKLTGRLLENFTTTTQTGAEITEAEMLHRYCIMFTAFAKFMRDRVFGKQINAMMDTRPVDVLISQLEAHQRQQAESAPAEPEASDD